MPGGQAPHFVSGTGRFSNYLTFLSTGLLSSRRPQLSAAPSPFLSTPFPIPLSSLFLPPSQGPSSVLFLCLCPEQGPSLRRGAEPALNACSFHLCSPPPPPPAPPEPLALFQEGPTALRPILFQTEVRMASHCTMTDSNHYSSEIRMKHQEA